MSLTMGTCPVRGGSALIKCADPNCKAYINQVSLKCAAVSWLVLAYIVQMRAAKGSPARDGSGGGARPPALLCRRHKVIQRLWPVVVLVRAVRRPPCCLLQTRPRSSLSPARHLRTCSNHAKVQGWPAYEDAACGHCRSRAAANNKYTSMPKVVKGGVYLSLQSWSHSRCSTGTCPIFLLRLWHTTLHAVPDSWCRFPVPEYNPRPTGGWSHGKGKARKRLLLHSKRLDKQAEVSDVLDRHVLQNAGHLVLWRLELLIHISLIP